MSNYSEYIKKVKTDDKERFFGKTKDLSNKYFEFEGIIDNDNIVILTNNVRTVKDNFVLVVGNNDAIYLKDWQVRKVHNYDEEINTYAVKLNRNFMKTYKFSTEFDVSIDDVETFDDLLKIAGTQKMSIATGWMN